MNDDLDGTWEEVAVDYFVLLSIYSPGVNE
jgi:hypothetical protein